MRLSAASSIHSCTQLFYTPRSQAPIPRYSQAGTLLQAEKLFLNSGKGKSQGGKAQYWPFSSA